MATLTWGGTYRLRFASPHADTMSSHCSLPLRSFTYSRMSLRRARICCSSSGSSENGNREQTTGIQVYRDIERVLTETVRQSQEGWRSSGDWNEVEGAWVLRPKNCEVMSIVHFVGGIFVGAAPQLAYRLFLERLAEKGVLVVATPYASGFDHFLIADEVQFKFERCLRSLQESVQDIPTFGIGHSLGSVIHLLIGCVSYFYIYYSAVTRLPRINS